MIEKKLYAVTKDGRAVHSFLITNNAGASAELITYGATVNAINVPDRDGELADVLVGFDDLAGHEELSDYQGQTVGRYANRLANGEFELDGVKFCVVKNENDKTCLHGGGELSHAVWNAIIIDDNAVEMTYRSPDGAFGFPGKVDFRVTFVFTDKNELEISYYAVSDKKTIINMTNHAYFNLSGAASGDILDHELQINADYFTPIDADSIPTGELRAVKGTAFDFNEPKPIGRDIGEQDEQLAIGRGYDHNFCLRETKGAAATAYDPKSGRALDVITDLRGVQLYTGNFLDGTKIGKQGKPLVKNAGFCLETQFYPDTPNHPDFPQCTLEAGKSFESTTVFRFYVRETGVEPDMSK